MFCSSCGNPLSTEAVICPGCGAATKNFASAARSDSVSGGNIVAAYILALLIPFIGFFAGIYLVAKKEPGHGAACMGLSVFAVLVYAGLLQSSAY